jgi:predicted glycosyltransferase involved in capsule biosynthesis
MNRLTDVTFIIPVRIDSLERARNLDLLIDFIIRYFDSKILIIETDDRQRYFVKDNNSRIHYFFEKDICPIFQHTRCMNLLYPKVDTPMIAGCDVDALALPEQITDTAEQVRCGNAVMGIAYDGRMYETSAELTQLYQETKNLDVLINSTSELRALYGDFSTGGAFIVDTEKYLQAGGENEYFLGWGCEDFERVKRVEILYSQPIYFAKGGLYHLWHPRGINSRYENQQSEISRKKEFLKVCKMTENELRDYINSWHWLASLRKSNCL